MAHLGKDDYKKMDYSQLNGYNLRMRKFLTGLLAVSFLWVSTHEVIGHTANVHSHTDWLTHGSADHDHQESGTPHHHGEQPGEHDPRHHDPESHDHIDGVILTWVQKVVMDSRLPVAYTVAAQTGCANLAYAAYCPEGRWAEFAQQVSSCAVTQRFLI